MRDMAEVFRAAGYSPLGPVALNIAAPDEGNMHLLERVANDEQKAQLIGPLASGETRSVFLMTEPDNGAGSDPSLLRTRAERVQGGWRISRSEEHTSELQSLMRISYAVFCLKKKKK